MGKNGIITSKKLYDLSPNDREFNKEIPAANDENQIETQILLEDLGNPSDIILKGIEDIIS